MRRIAIIGSGFSGLCLGIQLKKAGIESFTIFNLGVCEDS
jgi:cation diffusion facilitator CzcD-associated flavoprotein CzcO